MSDELPPDVRETLAEILEEAAEHARTRDADSVRTRLESVETVTEEEVPAGSGKDRLRHGSRQVRRTVDSEPLVAAEYLAAMRRLVEAEAADAGDGEGEGETDEGDGGDGDESGDETSGEGRDTDRN